MSLRTGEEARSNVMVCISAFGMEINQSDVDIVVHFGVPSSIESMIQEFG